MEARRFFQPVGDGKAQTLIIGTLCVNLRHILPVKGPQHVKQPLGLDLFILNGAKRLDPV